MSNPFLAEIRMFACNFAPRGWAFCQGQILSIAQNTALFSLLGTTYGGNGTTTFALPNLSSRTPLGQGQGPGLSDRSLGEQSGSETVTLLTSEMPAHTHTTNTRNVPSSDANYTNVPTAGYFVSRFIYHTGSAARAWKPASAPATTMNASTLQIIGGGQPHTNLQPYLAMNYCIATQGIYPSRN